MKEEIKRCSVIDKNQHHHFLRALSDETRRDMLQLLLKREINVSRIAEEILLDESTISYHLSILKKAGLLDQPRRYGKERYYRANRELLQKGVECFTRGYYEMYQLEPSRN
jgi:DNA-binding transcriptional ArsR family regulator